MPTRLSRLNKVALLFEYEVDAEGKHTLRILGMEVAAQRLFVSVSPGDLFTPIPACKRFCSLLPQAQVGLDPKNGHFS